MSVKTSEIMLLNTNEKRLLRDAAKSRERAKSLEEELHKLRLSMLTQVSLLLQVRSAREVEDIQKELEDQLEAEDYFSGLFNTHLQNIC